jgi:hypothetical protein
MYVINLQFFFNVSIQEWKTFFLANLQTAENLQNGLILTEIEDARNTLQVTLQQSYSNNDNIIHFWEVSF